MLDTVASYSIHASLSVPVDAGAHQLLLTVPGRVLQNESKLCQTLLTRIWVMPAYPKKIDTVASYSIHASLSVPDDAGAHQPLLTAPGCVVQNESKLCQTLLTPF